MRKYLPTLSGAICLSILLLFNYSATGQNCNCPNNLISNPSFESGITGWSTNVNVSGNTDFYTGTDFAVCDSKNAFLYVRTHTSSAPALFWQQVNNITPGNQYSLSINGGTHEPSQNHSFLLAFYNTSGVRLGFDSVQVDYDVDTNPGLKQYNLSGTAPTGTSYLRIEAKGYKVGSAANGDYLKVDMACLQLSCTPPTITECEAKINGTWSVLSNCSVTICAKSNLELSVNPNTFTGYSQTWSGPNNYTATGNDAFISGSVSTANAGTYTVTISNGTCTVTKSITVVVNSISDNIGTDQSFCGSGDPSSMGGTSATGSGAISYQWQSSTTSNACANGNGFSNLTTSKSYNPPLLSQSTYYRRISTSTLNALQCSDTNCVAINIQSKPNAGVDKTACKSSAISIAGSPATYTWSAKSGNPSGATLNNTTIGNASVSFSGSASGTFKFIYNASGCSDTMQIVVSAGLSAGTNGSTVVCQNSKSIINLFSLITGENTGGVWSRATGSGGSYTAGASTFTPTGATTSSFRYIIAASGSCQADTSIATVTINPAPTPNITAGSPTACINSPLQFCSEVISGIQYYEWDFGSGSTPHTSKNRCENVTWSTSGTKTVKLYYIMLNGCYTDTISYTVNVGNCCNGRVTSLFFNKLDGGTDIPITNGGSYNVSTLSSGLYNLEAGTLNVVDGIGSIKYTITGPTASTNTENSVPYNAPGGNTEWIPASGNYSVNIKVYSAQDAAGSICHDTTIAFNLINCSTAGGDGSTVVCQNSKSSINLFSLITGENTGGVWSRLTGSGGNYTPGASTFTPTGATTSTFRYIITANGSCHADTSIATVTINPAPAPNITTGSPTACINSPLQFCSEVITGIQYYEWNFGSGATPATSKNRCENVTWSTTGTKTIKLYYIMLNGCYTDTISYTVAVGNCCSGRVTGLYFNKLDGGTDLPITNGGSYSINTLGSLYNLEASTSGTIGSVKFTISGPTNSSNIENIAPYNAPGTESAFTPSEGTYTVNLKVYSESGASGSVCHDTTVTFNIVNPNCSCPNNLMTNSSFETEDVSGWNMNVGNDFYNGTGFAVCGARNAFLKIGTHTASSPALFWQQINSVSPGNSYQLTIYGGTHEPSQNHSFLLSFYNASGVRLLTDSVQIDYDVDVNPGLKEYTLNGTAPAGTFYLRVEGKGYKVGSATDGDYIKVDQACLQLTAVANASIGDRIWLDINANGIQDGGEANYTGSVTVNLYKDADNNGTITGSEASAPFATQVTTTGNYSFTGLTPGNYQVGFVLPNGVSFSPSTASTTSDATDSDANPTTGKTDITNLTSGETDNTWDAGVYQTSSLGDFVWNDLNANGIQDAGEPGIPNVTVALSGGPTSKPNTTTNSSGKYSFTDLLPGTYTITFTTPSGYTQSSPANVSSNTMDTKDSDPVGGVVSGITLVSGQKDTTIDAGFFNLASIGDYAWYDLNKNGIQDNRVDPNGNVLGAELPVAGIIVQLFNANTNLQVGPSKTTNSSGFYSFTGLTPGDYYIKVAGGIPAGYSITTLDANANSNDAVDNDINSTTLRSVNTNLVSGENDLTWDIGIKIKSTSSVEDPCSWQNNATDGRNGQFSEIVKITSAPGGMWKIIAQAGMYLMSSPAPPAAPIAVPIGTIIPYISDSTYRYEFLHIDSVGYTMKMTNGTDTLMVSNFCYYPDIIVNNFDTALCTSDPAITITASSDQPGGIFTYTITNINTNQVYNTNVINPAVLGTGIFTMKITYESPAIPGCLNITYKPFNISITNCPAAIGDTVFLDNNGNGIQDAGDAGMAGIQVTLLNGSGTPVTQDVSGNPIVPFTTSSNGKYSFTNLIPGSYKVKFGSAPSGYVRSIPNASGNSMDLKDSDADTTAGTNNGFTGVYTLAAGEVNNSVDAGYVGCPPGFTFTPQIVCGTQRVNLLLQEPIGYTGGVWTIVPSGSVSNPASVGSGTYRYTKTVSPQCVSTGTITITKIAPDYTPTITLQNDTTYGIKPLNLVLRISELLNVQACSDVYVTIPREGIRYSFVYDPFATSILSKGLPVSIQNSYWQYISSNPIFHVWKWVGDPSNGVPSFYPGNFISTLGVIGQYNPLGTDGFTTFTVQIYQGSGGEINSSNNTDSKSLIYFSH